MAQRDGDCAEHADVTLAPGAEQKIGGDCPRPSASGGGASCSVHGGVHGGTIARRRTVERRGDDPRPASQEREDDLSRL
jgi:hypothetical protein